MKEMKLHTWLAHWLAHYFVFQTASGYRPGEHNLAEWINKGIEEFEHIYDYKVVIRKG